eukprot:313657-Prorocentrum_minimum.AAC.1
MGVNPPPIPREHPRGPGGARGGVLAGLTAGRCILPSTNQRPIQFTVSANKTGGCPLRGRTG